MDDSEDPVFTLDGMLTEWRGPLETRFGGMSGVLRDPSDPKGAPLLGVGGMWRGPRSGIQGTYQAYLYNLETREVIGEMQGDYYDPAPGEGQFSGLWVIHGKP